MLKLAGMVIILLGAAALGMYQAGMYVNRLNNLYEVKKAFLYIQGEIRYMSTPLPERVPVHIRQAAYRRWFSVS